MRLGIRIDTDGAGPDTILERVAVLAAAGLDSAYFSQLISWDAIDLAAICAWTVPGIDVGTAVTQTYPRHPLGLASQTPTAQAVSGNRFTLGLGPSHPPIIEGQFGYSYDRPARHVREYLSALGPILRGADTDYHGETLTAVGKVALPGARAPSVLLATLGPVMRRPQPSWRRCSGRAGSYPATARSSSVRASRACTRRSSLETRPSSRGHSGATPMQARPNWSSACMATRTPKRAPSRCSPGYRQAARDRLKALPGYDQSPQEVAGAVGALTYSRRRAGRRAVRSPAQACRISAHLTITQRQRLPAWGMIGSVMVVWDDTPPAGRAGR